jgi:4-amino-4-deoxy-L-arabinose transferase-like glycosyltransferase
VSRSLLPVACALLAFLLFTLGSERRGLWSPDEPREAEIAREMWAGGDLVVPHLNGEPFREKPPLHAWATAAVFAWRGRADPAGARLASAVCGAALVGLTVRLALTALPASCAVLAGVALASMPLWWWHSARAILDVPLALFVALAVSCLYASWSTGSRRALDVAAFAVALAVLTKGPIGAVLPVLIFGSFLVISGELRWLNDMPWKRLALIAGLPVLAWLVPYALRDGGSHLRELVVKHHVQRYAQGWDHQRPWWHYLWTLPVSTLPWSLLAPFGFRERTPLARLAIAWVLAPLAFFSLSAAKRDLYMLPVFPGLALMVAVAADAARPRGADGRERALLTLGAFACLALAAALGPFVPEVARASFDCVAKTGGAFALPALSALWVIAALHLTDLIVRPRIDVIGRAARGLAAPALATAMLALGVAMPAVDALKSARALEPVLRGGGVAGYELAEGDVGLLTFMAGERMEVLHGVEELEAHLSRGGRVVGSHARLTAALAELQRPVRTLASAPSGMDRFTVVERPERSSRLP